MDQAAYYDPPSSPSSSSSASVSPVASPRLTSNSGNKLYPSARMMRKGKICAWGPDYEDFKSDQRVRRRLKLCLEEFLPEAAAEVGAPVPQNIAEAEAKRENKKRKREEDDMFRLPHLASPSPPLSTRTIAPMMALPRTYVDILVSPAMRHTLGSDNMEQGLQRTAAELLEGEKGLMQSLGRLREVLRVRERDVPVPGAPAEQVQSQEEAKETNGVSETNGEASKIAPLPHISDTDNLWRVTQELLQGQQSSSVNFTATAPGTVDPPTQPQPVPTATQRLFTVPSGITITAKPSTNTRAPIRNQGQPVRYNLDLSAQCRAVDDALERIAELLADCNEYKERLGEARDRVADVARARKKVWSIVKERAARELDREGKV